MAMMETIAADMKLAMKSRDTLRLETLRTLRAAFLEKQVEKRPSGGITPEDEIAVLTSALKKRKESSSIFREKGRPELAEQEEKEAAIIQEYLPKQLSLAEIEVVVRKVISAVEGASAKDFGRVMAAVMKELKGKADGKLVQETVKKLLEG